MDPTGEQQAIIDAYRTGRNLVIEAGAGTGKTTTLKMLGADKPGRKGTAGEPEPLAGLERELRRQSAPRLPSASEATAGTAWTTAINRCGAIIARVFQ